MICRLRRRTQPTINTGIFADAGFLLLIFFIVLTGTVEEIGIAVKLTPWSYSGDDYTRVCITRSNVMNITVNDQDEISARRRIVQIANLRSLVKEFIVNPQMKPDLAESPRKGIINFRVSRKTSYKTYLTVQNELLGAYHELWDELAMQQYGHRYTESMPFAKRSKIRNKVPLLLVELEPSK